MLVSLLQINCVHFTLADFKKKADMIRQVRLSGAPSIANTYNYYVLNTAILFDESPLSVEEISALIKNISANYPYFGYDKN